MMRRQRDSDGFTLVELLLAVALTLLLAGVMLAVTTTVLDLWRRSRDELLANMQAKLVLDFIERDLQAAVFKGDGDTWLAVDVLNDVSSLTSHGWIVASQMKPAGDTSSAGGTIESARFGRSGAWVRMVTTNVETAGSLPVAVSYQIARRPLSGAVSNSNQASIRYSLFRSAVSGGNTFEAGYSVLAGYGHSSATPPAQRTAGTLTNPNTTGDAIATNVVDFGVWLHGRDPAGELVRIFPVSGGDLSHAGSSRENFPEVVDVMVRVLTEEGAQRVTQMESGGGAVTRPERFATEAEWWWEVVDAHSRVYVRRVEIRGGGE